MISEYLCIVNWSSVSLFWTKMGLNSKVANASWCRVHVICFLHISTIVIYHLNNWDYLLYFCHYQWSTGCVEYTTIDSFCQASSCYSRHQYISITCFYFPLPLKKKDTYSNYPVFFMQGILPQKLNNFIGLPTWILHLSKKDTKLLAFIMRRPINIRYIICKVWFDFRIFLMTSHYGVITSNLLFKFKAFS